MSSSWKEMLEGARKVQGDTELIGNTLTEEELNREFDTGYGCSYGTPFTAWSENRVYFPVVYDGAEWVGSVPRHPCDEVTDHQGGQ